LLLNQHNMDDAPQNTNTVSSTSKLTKWSLSFRFSYQESSPPWTMCAPSMSSPLIWLIWYLANRTIYGVRKPLWPHRAVCRGPLTAEICARSWAIRYGISGRRSSIGTDFSAIISVLPIHFHLHCSKFVIHSPTSDAV